MNQITNFSLKRNLTELIKLKKIYIYLCQTSQNKSIQSIIKKITKRLIFTILREL